MLIPLAWFVTSVGILFLGHLFRTVRWRAILLEGGIGLTNIKPLFSLTIGYILNLVIPFRMSEIARGLTLSLLSKSDLVFIFASIIFERTIDLLIIGALFELIPFFFNESFSSLAFYSGLLFISLLFVSTIPVNTKVGRFCIWNISRLFNSTISTAILHFFSSLNELWLDSKILKSKNFWILTAFMWIAYVLSICCFALAMNANVFALLEDVYSNSINLVSASRLSSNNFYLIFYFSCPLIIISAYFFISQLNSAKKIRSFVKQITSPTRYMVQSSIDRLPKFKSISDYKNYLDRKFSNDSSLAYKFESSSLEGAEVHRIFPGGSEAITALIELGDSLRVRKFATSGAAIRLQDQYNWLIDNKNTLPVIKTLGHKISGDRFFYDMDYKDGTRGLYEAIHSIPVSESRAILVDLLDEIYTFHQNTKKQDATQEVVGNYLQTKICKNLNYIKDSCPEFFEKEFIKINNKEINIGMICKFSDPVWLKAQLSDFRQSEVHGDLTIENIILRGGSEAAKSWLLIDPNPNNGFSSPLLDYSKLFQSLHLGYEALNRAPQSAFIGGNFTVHLHTSHQYNELYSFLVGHLRSRFGEEALREIYFHEIVNYFRLFHYQLRRDQKRGIAFFTVLCILIQEFNERYSGALND